jgi:hypothetical protein
VSLAKLNILGVELDERLDEAGFRHVAVTVGSRLGARRIGASVFATGQHVEPWMWWNCVLARHRSPTTTSTGAKSG